MKRAKEIEKRREGNREIENADAVNNVRKGEKIREG